MSTVTSRDGTQIAFETTGQGDPLILVDGALCWRGSGPSGPLAKALADRFTVYTYDRRGRGQSGDAEPYSTELEVDDLAAVIEAAGGSAHVYAISSGVALALDAANRGVPMRKLALYEPPFIVDDSRAPMPADYSDQLEALLADGRRADMVRLFMRQVGVPRPVVAMMRFMPAWKKLKSVAHTLRYDDALMAGTQAGAPLPRDRWTGVTVPTEVLVGGKSPAWMNAGSRALTALLPHAEHGVVPGQTHMVKAIALAPVLTEWFGDSVRGSAPIAAGS
jgi:pimeloyl-ACP methyl ester carboxylesterase